MVGASFSFARRFMHRRASSSASSRVSAPNSTISQPLPSGSIEISCSWVCMSFMSLIRTSSTASSAIAPMSRISMTWSAACQMSSYPQTSSVRQGGISTRSSVASSTVTSVPSEPVSARATLKPFSGSNWSRL